MLFQGSTADVVYQEIISDYVKNGWQPVDGRGGGAKEILHAQLLLTDPRQRWLLSRIPSINPGLAIAEVVWIMRGNNESGFLKSFFPDLVKFQGESDTFHSAYGHRLRKRFGFDQLEHAYQALSHNPHSRQVVLQIWDTTIDFPDKQGQPRDPDIPCNVLSMLKIRNNRLEWMQVMRSNDLWRGLPYNLIQFTSLQEILSGWLGISPGDYCHLSDSLHLYAKDEKRLENIKIERPNPLHNDDSLALNRKDSERVFQEFEKILIEASKPNVRIKFFRDISKTSTIPVAYYNLLLIACAELARRKTYFDCIELLIQSCSNQCLKQIWNQWFIRFRN